MHRVGKVLNMAQPLFWRPTREEGTRFSPSEYDITPEHFVRASQVIAPFIQKTALVESPRLSARLGRPVFLKCENQQVTGSFKIRGALARLSVIEGEARYRGVIAASAGNHGIGLAHACRQYGIPGLVVVPETTPQIKIRQLQELYIKVRSFGTCFDEAEAYARELAAQEEATYISPYDDPWIIAGNGGTLGLEIAQQLPEVTTVVAPVGGGGLASGLALALPRVAVVGVNTQASPAMTRSLMEGSVFGTFDSAETLAEGLEGGVSPNTVALCAHHLAGMGVVSEDGLRRGISFVARHHKEIIEGSAAAAVAAILEDVPIPGDGPVCLVLTGRNIDRGLLREILLSDRES